MTEVHFHYSNGTGALVDRFSAITNDFAHTRAYAEMIVRALIARPGMEDWRGWRLIVRDDVGAELFDLPFASLLGKPH